MAMHHAHPHYRTKYRLDTAVAVVFIFFGACTVSAVFGMMLFPVFTHICANALLVAVARVGYAGVVTLAVGLFLEAYNLFEHHRRHVAVVVAVTIVAATVTILMIHFVSVAYTCSL
jgi:hypothetical protein